MTAIVNVLLALGLLAGDPSQGVRTTGSLEREVLFTQNVLCTSTDGTGKVRDVRCAVAVPESNPRQEVAIEWMSSGGRLVRDGFGNAVLVVERPDIAPGGTLEVGWRARVRLQSAQHQVNAARLASPLAIPRDILARYLADGDAYGLGDPALHAVADAARAAASDPLDLAFRLNELVRDRITYERDGSWDPAPEVWRRRTGSCSEYHYTFASLCRCAGLPVRWVGASALRSGSDLYVDTVFHRWSEVYLAGYGWFPVDVSRNDCEDGGPVNESFGRTAAPLLELSRGDGGDLLGWGYVSDVRGTPEGPARLASRRKFTWMPPPPERLPAIPLASMIGR